MNDSIESESEIDLLSKKDIKKSLRNMIYIMIFSLLLILGGLDYIVSGDPFGESTAGVHMSPGIETRVTGFIGFIVGIFLFRIAYKKYHNLKNKIPKNN
mgnify:FL=1